jgi:isopenicillin-N epimerase
MTASPKDQFLLDPAIHYLNHGSFGACPRPVFDEYQRWQRELERQPAELLGRRITGLMAEARAALAAYLGVDADEVIYFPNPTTAVNVVARSLRLQPSDEVLATDHEYGALDRTWRFLASQAGFSYRCQPMPLPMTTAEDFVERFWAGVTPRTRVIFISHISSSTALIFPVEAICARARAAGLLTIVDGAHVPGQIALRPREIGADFYAGACHKWLCAPKGSAFLYARRDVQPLLNPLVVSWGYESETPSGSRFVDQHEWQGTRDVSAFLATPAAIRFQAEHNWDQVRLDCHALVRQARERIGALTGLPPICPDSREAFVQMATVRLPLTDTSLAALKAFQARLYDEHRVEVPVFAWNGQPMLRVSVQGYNSQEDTNALITALESML